MTILLKKVFAALSLLMLVCSMPAFGETIRCAECGMMVDLNSNFSSKLVQGNDTRYFCDIGDMFSYLNRKGPKDAGAEVKDFATGEWIDARKASYVHAGNKFKSPMGWGLAAFKDKTSAAAFGSVMDFEGTAKALK